MKVLFIGNDKSILTGENGDARERMKEYAKHFDKLSIVVFSLKKDNLKNLLEKNLEVYPTHSSSRWFFLFDAMVIIKNLKVDLISTQDPFIAGFVGVIAKLLWGTKLNIQLHNDFFDNPYFRSETPQNYIFYWLGKLNLLFADSVRVVNHRMIKDRRYFTAPVATDLKFFWSMPHKKIFNQVVTVSRLAKQKNLPLFFALAKEFPDKKFVVVGEGEERVNLEKIKPANVSLVGQKTREEVRKIFSESDIFVLTSNYEGWGLSVVEALAAGLPVVITDTGCAGEVINNEIGGLVTDLGDKTDLVEGVRRLYVDRVLRKKLIVSGQDALFKNYSREKIMGQFIFGLKQTAKLIDK